MLKIENIWMSISIDLPLQLLLLENIKLIPANKNVSNQLMQYFNCILKEQILLKVQIFVILFVQYLYISNCQLKWV